MDAKDLLLEEHNRVHSAAVGGDKMSMAERTFGGLTDEQMRVRPREDMNSLAWLMWHISRAEDVFANLLISGRDQVLDGGWSGRLKITRPDFRARLLRHSRRGHGEGLWWPPALGGDPRHPDHALRGAHG